MSITANDRFTELLNEIRSIAPSTVTFLKITITADGVRVTEKHNYADQLKKRSATMRNIKGDWIS